MNLSPEPLNYAINHKLEGPAGAPLLVFSNSLGADLSMWDAQAAEFSKCFRVLRYDNRGHGQSTAPSGPYSIADIAGDAAHLIEQIGEGRRAHFCGLSLGGMVGMWLATNRPELIDKLILCNTAALMGPSENWDTRIAAVSQGGMRAVVKSVIERWFSERFRATSPEIVGRIEQNFEKANVEGYTGCCAAIRDMDQRQTISAIKTPTLVIGGTFDPSTPPPMCKYIAETIPGASYLELPTRHLSNVEAAPAFNAAVSQFLNSENGVEVRRAVLGDAHVDRSLSRINSFNGEFQDLITRYAWGEIWTRPGLPRHSRSLITIAMMVALNRTDEFKLHIRAASNNGVTRDEIKEVLLQTAIYCGVPAANSAFHAAEAVFAEMDKDGSAAP